MSETILKLMKDYNKLVKRYKDAEVYFKREDITLVDRIKQSDNIVALVREMVLTATELNKLLVCKMSREEIEHGFPMKEDNK